MRNILASFSLEFLISESKDSFSRLLLTTFNYYKVREVTEITEKLAFATVTSYSEVSNKRTVYAY